MRAAALFLPTLVAGQDVFLGQTSNANDADVIIIGAGWAGMGAANHLSKAGVKFLVLEADNRTGGRTKAITFGNPDVGQYVFEQGSNWVCGLGTERTDAHSPSVRRNPVLDLSKQAGLETALIPGATDGNMSNYFAIFDEYGQKADADGELRKKANDALDCLNRTAPSAKSSVSVRDGLSACGWNPSTNAEWALDWAVASDESGVHAKNSALVGFAPDPTYTWWGKDDVMVIDQNPRGYARVIDEMVKDTVTESDVVLNAHVTNIDWSSSTTVTVSTKDGRTFKSKHVINTVSLGVLKKHHTTLFTPALPTKQAEDLMGNHQIMANLTHVLVQFPSVWWDNSLPAWVSANAGGQENYGLFTAWHNMNADGFIPGSNTLLSFLGEPEASKFESLSEADLMVLITDRLRTQNPQLTIPDASAAWLKNWGIDPLTYGAYRYSGTGVTWSGKWKAALKQNKKSMVQFAGESTCDMLDGYTHGALASGIQAAATYLHSVHKGPTPSKHDDLYLCSWYDYYA